MRGEENQPEPVLWTSSDKRLKAALERIQSGNLLVIPIEIQLSHLRRKICCVAAGQRKIIAGARDLEIRHRMRTP